jgi:23S rRNA pseudouridine1911/1915/1917 synthase
MIDPPALVILHEDAHLVAVSKPAGLLTQGPPWRGPTLEQAVRHYLAPDAPEAVYLGTVHRLDRPVSGVVVWAKTPKAARRLSRQFGSRRVAKEYWAVVDGLASWEDEAIWEDWLTRHSDADGRVRVEAAESADARHALTRAQVEPGARVPAGACWLRLRPETGRTHQLRAQSARHVGPIWGDAAYGSARDFPSGIALHARTLTVEHPALERALTLVAPLPEAWTTHGFVPPS